MSSAPGFRDFTHGPVLRAKSVVLHAGVMHVPASGVIGLVGINGAGKTTLMLAIADLLHRSPWSRPVVAFRDDSDHKIARVAYSPQRPTFPAWLSALEVVRMFGVDYDELQASQPTLLLEELRNVRANRLSAGQTQGLSIALALHLDSDITLLDEPFAPLDFRRRIALSELLQSRRSPAHRNGLTIVSTQSAAELVDVCDWLVVLNAGRYALSAPMHVVMHGALGDEHARSIVERRVLDLLS